MLLVVVVEGRVIVVEVRAGLFLGVVVVTMSVEVAPVVKVMVADVGDVMELSGVFLGVVVVTMFVGVVDVARVVKVVVDVTLPVELVVVLLLRVVVVLGTTQEIELVLP